MNGTEDRNGTDATEGRTGKVTVMATGVFDILHLGHVHYLQEARKLGDRLVVVVANDNTVRQFKHEPITCQEMRLDLIKALRVVDEAYLGHEGDPYRIVRELHPEIIALGYDQHHDAEKIRQKTGAMGLRTKVVRLPKFDHDLNGTRKIINKIIRERSTHQQHWDDMEEERTGDDGPGKNCTEG